MKRKAPIQRLLERPRIKQEGEKEVPPDDDDLFGELHAAAAAVASGIHNGKRGAAADAAEFSFSASDRAIVAEQLHIAWDNFKRHTQAGAGGVAALQSTQRCDIARCRGEPVKKLAVFAMRYQAAQASSGARFAHGLEPALERAFSSAGGSSSVLQAHVCSEFCIHGPLGENWFALPALALAALLPRGAHKCNVHGKIHCCVHGECQETYRDELGFVKCVLSGFAVSQAYEFSFAGGTREKWQGESLVDCSGDVGDGGGASARRREHRERPLATLAAAAAETNDVGNETRKRGYLPASGMFADAEQENTFGTGLGSTLDELYEACWRAVDALTFGARRSLIEHDRAEALTRDARRRALGYITEETKAGRFAFLDTAAAAFHRTTAAKRVYAKYLVLPKGAIARLHAYYTMVLVEFTVSLFALIDELREEPPSATVVAAPIASGRTTNCLDRLNAYDSFALAINSLLLLVADFGGASSAAQTAGEDVLFAGASADPVLGMLPESSVIETLGVPEKLCTGVKKDIKQTIMLAKKRGISLACLRVTSIPAVELYFGGAGGADFDVIDRFLALRRAAQAAAAQRAAAAAAQVAALIGEAR